MTSRRKALLYLLPVLLLLPLGLAPFGQMGPVEISIWLALIVLWVIVFANWGSSRRTIGQDNDEPQRP